MHDETDDDEGTYVLLFIGCLVGCMVYIII